MLKMKTNTSEGITCPSLLNEKPLIQIVNYMYIFSQSCKKKARYLRVNVLSTKVHVLIGNTVFMSPTGDETAILHGHPSHPMV